MLAAAPLAAETETARAALSDSGAPVGGLAFVAAAFAAILVLAALFPGARTAAIRTLLRIVAPLAQAFGAWAERLERELAQPQPGALEAHENGGEADDEQQTWALSLEEFGETSVREIMISRLDVVALPVTATWDEALETLREGGFSRVPLYDEHLDRILGVIYAKDLLLLDTPEPAGAPVDWTAIARPALFVPITRPLDDVLRAFQRMHRHLAIVVDEYGGTAGLVTLEDLMEEIVGDIQDEHDTDEEVLYERVDSNTLRVDARLNLDDINELLALGHADAIDTDALDFETVGGLVYHLTGDVPEVGAEVEHEGLHLRVETVENYRIGQVLVHVNDEAALAQE